MDEACEQALEVAKSIEAHQLEYDEHGFDILREKIAEGIEHGINWK